MTQTWPRGPWVSGPTQICVTILLGAASAAAHWHASLCQFQLNRLINLPVCLERIKPEFGLAGGPSRWAQDHRGP